ncbi:MAG: nucleotide exchange factor GrpE [Cellvibrionaceae bacterium]|nr:nucleotide exchange factor GrpE [Cellvibrionaceae bacterium]
MANQEKSDSKNNVHELEDDQVTLDSKADAQDSSKSDPNQSEAEVSENSLSAEVERLKEELEEARNKVLLAAADVQNVRRRAEQDVEKAHKFALDKFVSALLPVADNLERAVEASKAEGAEMSAVVEGVELTLKSLIDALTAQKVEQVDPHGEPFNPELHQAMTAVEQADVEPNTVVNVFQRGYTLHGRLVRPAMVVVSKAAESSGK